MKTDGMSLTCDEHKTAVKNMEQKSRLWIFSMEFLMSSRNESVNLSKASLEDCVLVMLEDFLKESQK